MTETPAGSRLPVLPRGPVLVVASDHETAERYVGGLRDCGVITLSVDTSDTALDIMEAVDFAAVFVDVPRADDWWLLLRLAATPSCTPVLIPVARMVPDGRYQRLAFAIGCAAFIGRPADGHELWHALQCVSNGEWHVEVEPRSAGV